MKRFFSFLLLFSAASFSYVKAQYQIYNCESGNCKNGAGTLQMLNGKYVGECKNNLPNGLGKADYLWIRPDFEFAEKRQEEGFFFDGLLLKGKRTTEIFQLKLDEPGYTGIRTYEKTGNYFLIPYAKPETTSYPIALDYKKGYYRFANDITWKGKMKNDLPTGKGFFYHYDELLRVEATCNQGVIEQLKRISDERNIANGYDIISEVKTENNFVTSVVAKNRNGSTIAHPVLQMPVLEILVTDFTTGLARIEYKDGSIKSGFFIRGELQGQGFYFYNATKQDSGMFKRTMLHGYGKRRNKDTVETGFFYKGIFLHGTITINNITTTYPVCLSGNCENGMGKVQYRNSSEQTNDVYEGNFLDGLPTGYGKRTFTYKGVSFVKEGNFYMGELNGYAVVTGTGTVKKAMGYFTENALIAGSIEYYNGYRFESIDKTEDAVLILNQSYYRKPEFIEKPIYGGIGALYLPYGATAIGYFTQDGFTDIIYKDEQGNSFQINETNLTKVGMYDQKIYSRNCGDLYYLANQYKTKSKQYAINLAKENAEMAAKQKKLDAQNALLNNPNNWQVNQQTEKCGECYGKGTKGAPHLGGDVDVLVDVYDAFGNFSRRSVITYDGIGPKRARRITCPSCRGKGVITLTKRTYKGPVL